MFKILRSKKEHIPHVGEVFTYVGSAEAQYRVIKVTKDHVYCSWLEDGVYKYHRYANSALTRTEYVSRVKEGTYTLIPKIEVDPRLLDGALL